ncbi:hypothetical protein STEG23_001712 [Scotinomys teguina]
MSLDSKPMPVFCFLTHQDVSKQPPLQTHTHPSLRPSRTGPVMDHIPEAKYLPKSKQNDCQIGVDRFDVRIKENKTNLNSGREGRLPFNQNGKGPQFLLRSGDCALYRGVGAFQGRRGTTGKESFINECVLHSPEAKVQQMLSLLS